MADGGNIEDEFDNILKNPVFLSALNVANYETAGSPPTPDKHNDVGTMQHDTDNEIDEAHMENAICDSNSNTAHRTIEKLRILIPSMASPTSMHSSSSDGYSPVRSKKNKKRFCIKCNLRFKHTADWLEHLKKHISSPSIILEKLDTNNQYYKDYLERAVKRCRSPDNMDSLKIRLKIPRTETSNPPQENYQHLSQPTVSPVPTVNPFPTISPVPKISPVPSVSPSTTATPPAPNECRIRVLRAEEIKQSPPRSPLKMHLPENAMVAVPSENRIHYECPTFGLNQYAEEAMTEDTTAQILKHLLETPPEPPEPNEWDSSPNEFISIDRLAHTCKTCDEKYPDLNFLREHQRLTGHGERDYSPSSILEPIQEMTVGPAQQYHSPQTNNLQHLLSQSKNTPSPQQQPTPMYGQPPVLPSSLHQMENQLRNFAQMNHMANRPPHFAMPPRHPSQLPPNYPMHRFLPPSQMGRSNHPINMTPFLDMNPDMYNPQQMVNNNNNNINNNNNNNNNIQMNGNVFNRPPNQMMNQSMNRFMPQPPTQQSMMQRFPMQQPPQRPPMNGQLSMNRSLRNIPPYPLRPSMQNNMGKPPQMMPNPRPMMPPVPLNSLEQQQKARLEQLTRNREIENRPYISNAPRTEGLPVIESVQSGAITLNSTTKKPNEPGGTIQISDQITLSVKNKDGIAPALNAPALKPPTLKPPEKSIAPPIKDTNTMKSILANRGITVKSASKLLEKPKSEDSNKTMYASAEAAVQKLQMNNSVSIISKKKVTAPISIPPVGPIPAAKPNDTIDLSNDDDTPARPPIDVPSKPRPTILKCSFKKCEMRFSSAKALRDHNIRVHQLQRLSKFRCTICSTRFPSNEAVRVHIQKMHPNSVKPKPDLGIPIVNFADSNVRKKMLSLGFTNFLPITNISDDKSELFGMPIININGPSINNLKNLFDTESTKVVPINPMRTIPRPKVPAVQTPQPAVQSTQSSQSNQPPRPVPKLISANVSVKPTSTETLSILPN